MENTGKPVKVGICIPNEGITLVEAYDNHLQFACHIGKIAAQSPDKFEFRWGSVGRVLTPVARERLTEFAMEHNMDFMLQIDNDMLIPEDLFERLYDTMVKYNADVVAPLAFMRHEPHYPVLYRTREGYDPVAKKPYFEREFVKNYPKDSVVECDAVGFGSALVRMSMVRKMKRPWFMSTTGAGEDIWFCKCAKEEAGARIFMDTRIKLGHLGVAPVIDEEYYDKYSGNEHRKVYGDAPKELVNA